MSDSIVQSLVSVGRKEKSDYLQIFNKKRKSRWDDNIKPCKKNKINNNLDMKNSRKTRWGPEYEKTFLPLTVTSMPDGIDIDLFEIAIRKQRLEDVNRRIQTTDYENVDPDIRSPSPEPIYDSKTGKRLNLREVRNKEKYVKEKNSLIEELILLDKSYKAPNDYRPPKKTLKIYINEYDNEKHKLIGLILGPGGVTQRELEKKSGCRVSVRGKGSNWIDKTYHDEGEALHVFLVADTEEQIRKGISLVEPILDPLSEEHFKHKQMQKNAISLMYGYKSETSCENCGEKHRTWACPENFGNFTKADVKCSICGDLSHPTVDCPERNNIIDKNEAESELIKFIREIDEFKKNAEILVLESERKADDIRNSVLFTGKIKERIEGDINELVNEVKNEDKNIEIKEEYKEELKNEAEDNKLNQEINYYLNNNITDNETNGNIIENKNTPTSNSNYNNTPTNQPQLDYKVPLIPIVDNPNVIRAAPVSYINPNPINYMNQPFINPTNYYNPYTNPVNPMPMPMPMSTNSSIYNPYNRGLNFISSNFQGKIPMSYGVNPVMHNYMMRPQMNYNINMKMNIPTIPNMPIRINTVQNQNMFPFIRNNLHTNQITINTININNQQNINQPPEPEEPHPEFQNNLEDDIEIDKVE